MASFLPDSNYTTDRTSPQSALYFGKQRAASRSFESNTRTVIELHGIASDDTAVELKGYCVSPTDALYICTQWMENGTVHPDFIREEAPAEGV